jgi:hypothetical protein
MKMAENALRKMVVCFANVQEGRDVAVLREMARAASSWPGGTTYSVYAKKKGGHGNKSLGNPPPHAP